MRKPIIVVINDTAFVHGGLSPKIAELGLDGVNGRLKSEVIEYVDQLQVLNDASLLDPAENFHRHAAALEALPVDVERPAAITAAIETVVHLRTADVHAPDSPIWYRGNVGCSALIEVDRIAAALEAIDATRVVIGHTPTLTRQVLSRLNGRVVEIDTGMLNEYYNGTGNALIIEGDSLTVVNESNGEKLAIPPHPRRVGRRDPSIGAERLERILELGEITPMSTTRWDLPVVKVEFESEKADAVFVPNPRGRRFVPELAAYRLDRFLGLGMVPVTVSREYDGKTGVLQFLPDTVVDETRRMETGQGSSAWCPLPEQWKAMYVFDVLTFNPGRPQDRMLYSQDNWQLLLTGNGRSFESKRSRPAYLKDAALNIGSQWQERLRSLTDDVLAERFGDTLDKRRRRALGQRRDVLLEEAAAP